MTETWVGISQTEYEKRLATARAEGAAAERKAIREAIPAMLDPELHDTGSCSDAAQDDYKACALWGGSLYLWLEQRD